MRNAKLEIKMHEDMHSVSNIRQHGESLVCHEDIMLTLFGGVTNNRN